MPQVRLVNEWGEAIFRQRFRRLECRLTPGVALAQMCIRSLPNIRNTYDDSLPLSAGSGVRCYGC